LNVVAVVILIKHIKLNPEREIGLEMILFVELIVTNIVVRYTILNLTENDRDE